MPRVSTLELRFLVLDDRLDWPVVQMLVDGREAFTDRLPGWQGFDPVGIFGDRSPFLPGDAGRRVAVYRCSCGIEGCGVVECSCCAARGAGPSRRSPTLSTVE